MKHAASRMTKIANLFALALLLRQAPAPAAEPIDTNLLPNGGFEFWMRRMPRGSAALDAPAPLRWDLTNTGASIAPAAEARSGQYALAVRGGGTRQLSMRYLEVYPGAAYRFGAWVRGAGRVSMRIDGVVLEGVQTLAEESGEGGADWTHVGGEFTVPRHVLDRLIVTISVSGGLLLDDVHVSARLAQPYDADAVLREKPRRDDHTLFFEDFDGEATGFTIEGKSGTGLTPANAGRFGRGLRMQRPGLAVFPLSVKAMPAEGTLEWWMTLDDFDKVTYLQITSGQRKPLALFRGIAVLWCDLPGSDTLTVPDQWFGEQARDGQWVHLAVTWDQDFYRVYVNGVLAVRSAQAPGWPAAPTTLQAGSAREAGCWNGRLDELRLSNVCRLRAPVPAGFTPFPPLKPEAAPDEPAASVNVPSRPYDAKALRAERAKRPLDEVTPTRPGVFERQPDETGAYTYEATSLKPLVDGLPFAWATNAAGLVSAQMHTIRTVGIQYMRKYNDGAYWTLAMPEGEYGLELLHTQGGVGVYLNGRIVQMTSAGDELRTGRNETFTPLRSGKAVRLRPGDEIALMASTPYARDWLAARLRLVPGGVEPGRHYARPNYDPHTAGPDTALAVTGQALFYGRDGRMLPDLLPRDGGRNQGAANVGELETAEDGRPAVRCELFNPLPTPVEVEYKVDIRSYYRLPVGGETARVRLAPHTSWRKLVAFDALPDERAFSAELKVQVVEPKDEAAWRRAMNWPELDWIDFFPGYRQGLPWPEPFEDVDLRRIEFSEPVRAVRRQLVLDGDEHVWEAASSTNWQARWPCSETLDWTNKRNKGGVPSRGPKVAPGQPTPHAFYQRRTFVLPENAADESMELYFEGTTHEAALYVNDREVGRVRGGNVPLRADITAATRPGTNTLVVVARDALAIMNPDYVNPKAPAPNLEFLDAPGHYDPRAMAIRSITLRMSPRVSARRLQVITSTAEKTLRARFELVNNRDRALKLRVRARVLDAGKPVFELGGREVELAAGKVEPLVFAKSWPDARWWWPFDPHLYVMAVETFNADTGERLDLLRERFGFRESWIDGPHMMFNDMVIRPKGSWLGYREAPNHFARGVEGSGGPDWCDERGMLGGSYITALGNTSSRHNVERDAFWEAAETNAILAAWERINNPSVARWDMSNEWLKYLHGGNPEQGADRFKKLSDIVRAFDPTRWTTFGAEGDVRGRMDHYDFHYMSPYFQNRPGAPRMRGVNAYYPDGEFWRRLDRDAIPTEGVRLCPLHPILLQPDRKMVFEREFLWKSGNLMRPTGTGEYLGEKATAWSDWDAASGPALWVWKQKIDGHRDLGVSLINHYTHPGLKRRAMALQTFIAPEVQHHGFGGRAIERRYALLQDLFRTCEMTFRWTLRGPDGTRLDGGEDRQRMSSGTTHRGVFRVKLPDVNTRTVCTLLLELESDGNVVMAEERDIDVWPSFAEATEGKPDAPVKVGELARKVVLFEPGRGGEFKVQSEKVQSEKVQSSRVQSSRVQSARVQSAMRETRQPSTAAALAAMGLSFERITNFDAPILTNPHTHTPLPLLVIAEDALNESNRTDVAALAGFVERGGRVLILRQAVTPAGLPAETRVDPQHWASQCYIRAGNHPVVAGWTDWDFHFWADDRAVVRGGYGKPASGAATPILDSGEIDRGTGLEWAGLMEQYRGSGLYLLCQLPVIAKVDEEPMAREVLARMLNYLGSQAPLRAPVQTLTVFADRLSPMAMRLERIGADVEIVGPDAPVDGSSRVVIDAAFARATAPGAAEAWGRAIESGAVIAVAEAGPEDAVWLSELAGAPVQLGVPPFQAWDGRGLRRAWTSVTAGLSHFDQYWKRYDWNQSAGRQVEDPEYVIEPFQQYAVSVADQRAVESVWPGAMVEISRGAGRLILDQRNLYTGHPDLASRAERCVSALVLGMDGQIEAPPPKREMARNLKHRPVDLGAVANRALRDEDGSGWIGAGPEDDLRGFPGDGLVSGRIPFTLAGGARQAVVLSRPDGPLGEAVPGSVTIPLGYAVEGLHFLHTAARVESSPVGQYTIVYADGTSYGIRLRSGRQVRDWTRPGAMTGGSGVTASVAWTGSTPRHPLVGVYRMTWINPWPERRVEAVRFELPPGHAGVPILLALTASVPADAPAATPTKADPSPRRDAAGALKAAGAAEAALRAGDDARAKALAADALRLDPSCESAHAVLGDLAEKAGTDDERVSVYRAWIAAGPRNPRPFNRVGEILEKRKDYRGARAAYTRSLELEWNQPPILEAKSRVERLME